MLYLTDDGTMDTVIMCDDCGEEMRYNPDPEEVGAASRDERHDWRVDAAFDMAKEDHDCNERITS